MLPWLVLLCGIVLSVVGNITVKQSHGYENMLLGIAAIACFNGCNIFFGLAVKALPLGIAAIVWMGLNTLGVIIASYFLFGERFSLLAGTLMVVIVICSALLVTLVKS